MPKTADDLDLDVEALIATMAEHLAQRIAARGLAEPALVGIRTGGVWVAERLRRLLGIDTPLGELDIAFYRDDFSRIGMHPTVAPSTLPFEIEERNLVLVDDILYTGRTIRAAMNEIFDYGRPRTITLAVLVDRSGRELPIDANVYGTRLRLGADDHVKLLGPDPLRLEFCARRS